MSPTQVNVDAIQIEGLWTAEFGSSGGIFGGGVVVFQNGKISGGDATYFYLGSYEADGRNFRAELKVSPFIDGAISVFGASGQSLTLKLEGSFTQDGHAIAKGRADEVGGVQFAARLTKRS